MFSHLVLTGLLFASSGFHGATLSFYGEHVHRSGTYESRLNHLADAGAQSVSFVVFWSLKDCRDDRVLPSEEDRALEDVLVQAIRKAQALGLSVMLMPVLRLHVMRDGEWRGKLYPKQLSQFWQSYRSFIIHYATLAQREGVSLYSVGSELSSLEHHDRQWRALIREVRRVYHGQLTYSANWDHFQQVPFWDVLDMVGISAYFELTKDRSATQDELLQSWQKIRLVLLDWLSVHSKPLLFTELGYPSVDGGAVHPWDYTRKGAIDLEEQRRAFSAFRTVWAQEPALMGVYFWNWWGPIDGQNTWYTIPGKPAMSEVKQYFKTRRTLAK